MSSFYISIKIWMIWRPSSCASPCFAAFGCLRRGSAGGSRKSVAVGCSNERAFKKMRGLLVLAYHMIEDSAEVKGSRRPQNALDHAIEQASNQRDNYN